jgi:hypothetical protein
MYPLLILIGWFFSMFFAADLGRQRNAGMTGLILGCLFGPVGILAAGLLDGRPNCIRCGGRQNVKSSGRRYEICEHCGADNVAPMPEQAPSRQEVKPETLLSNLATFAVENDPTWESSLDEAKRKLEAAGLIK